MDIFLDLPEKKRQEVMIPHYVRARASFYRISKLLQKAKIKRKIYTPGNFEELWSKSIFTPPKHVAFFPFCLFGSWYFSTLTELMGMHEAFKHFRNDTGRESIQSFAEEATYLLNFEHNYRKVLRPSEALIGQLTTTEITPQIKEIQLPYPCVYVQFPRPVATADGHGVINGFYMWETSISKEEVQFLHSIHVEFAKEKHIGAANVEKVKNYGARILCMGWSFCDLDASCIIDRESINTSLIWRDFADECIAEEYISKSLEFCKNEYNVHGQKYTGEKEFLIGEWLLRLAFNLCLWLSSKQEEVVETKHAVLEKLKKAKDPVAFRIQLEQQLDGKLPVTDIIIGQHVVIDEETRIASAQSQTAKGLREMKIHWRRAHWRRVAIGEGRVLREWRWFKNVLVNKDKGGVPLYSTYELRKGV